MKSVFATLSKRLIFGIFVISLLAGCFPTVDYVDIERYMGTWHQISANPAFFNEDLVGVTAKYTLNEDGTVEVINRGYVGTLDGPLEEILGTAVVVDTESNAKLNVTFSSVPFSTPFANYLIVVLDQEQYTYAAVTDPSGSTLFILSRTPQMETEIYEMILNQLDAINVPTSRLIFTPQPEL